VYYLGPDGIVYDDGYGDMSRPYGFDRSGRRIGLDPETTASLTARYYADNPPQPVGGLSSAQVAAIRSRFPIGDAVARLTSMVGIQPCAPCKQRQATLNQVGDRIARYFR
jgi:hypothetical protein